jgi:hypothetical protein
MLPVYQQAGCFFSFKRLMTGTCTYVSVTAVSGTGTVATMYMHAVYICQSGCVALTCVSIQDGHSKAVCCAERSMHTHVSVCIPPK